jgi:hypothetical protein
VGVGATGGLLSWGDVSSTGGEFTSVLVECVVRVGVSMTPVWCDGAVMLSYIRLSGTGHV